MSFLNEKNNSSNLTRHYRKGGLSSSSDALKWISSLRTVSGIRVSYILLSDLLNRSDEGSDNCQLPGDVRYEDLAKVVKEKNVDLISVYGSFADKPVVIGINMNLMEEFITVRKNNKADIDALERELALG